MKTPTILATVTLFGALLFGASQQSQAQVAVKIDAKKPEFDAIQSPLVGGNTNKKKWTPQDWLEFEVEVELDARPEPKDKHIDTLSVTWYVAVDNVNRTGEEKPMLLLKKQVTHVNVPIGEKFFLSAYLSPATVKRLTNGGRASKNTVRAVGGEINCPGAREAVRFTSFGTTKKPFWTSEKVGESARFPLLSKDETPFKFLWWDRYLEIRPGQ